MKVNDTTLWVWFRRLDMARATGYDPYNSAPARILRGRMGLTWKV